LFDAIGIRPTSADAIADRLSADAIDRHLARIREAVIAGVRQLPPHADYLRRCWAAAPTGAAA
jgi:hypothetical protein